MGFDHPHTISYTAITRALEDVNLKHRTFMERSYTNSDFQSDLESRKYTSGYVFTLGGGAISWRNVKQSSIADSTMEVEYIATSKQLRRSYG